MSELKTYIMTITKHDGEVIRLTVDLSDDHLNMASYIFAASCQSILFGFGDAKATKLYRIIEAAGTMSFMYDGKRTNIQIDVM